MSTRGDFREAELARIGQEEAGLDRVWGENMLRAGRIDHVMEVVNQLWGAREVRTIPMNLPKPAHTMFVGREAEMAHLLKLLSPSYGAHLISVDGIGGVGKTALHLLRTGLPVVERNKDKRRIAHYKRFLAHLEQKRGNLDEAHRWTQEALDGFERLGMYPEIEQMRVFLQAGIINENKQQKINAL